MNTPVKATGPNCPECKLPTWQKANGNWCPRCRGWVVPFERGGERRFRLHNSYEPIRYFSPDLLAI